MEEFWKRGEAAAREGKGDAGGTSLGSTEGNAELRRARQRCWSPGLPSPDTRAGRSPRPGPAEAAAGQGGGEGRREGVAEGKGAAPAGLAAGTHHTMP